MGYLEYAEPIQHRTGGFPLAYYLVDEHHPRYHMRMHWHRETELLWMRKGILHLFINEEPMDILPGDLVVLGEGALHGGDAEDGVYECAVLDPYALIMHIDECREALRPILGRTMMLRNETIFASCEMKGALERLFGALRMGVEGREMLIVGAVNEVFAYLSCRKDACLDFDASPLRARAEQIKPALEYIENHYASAISLDILARQTGLSSKYFCRCFRAVVHRSPIDYLNYYRIECASLLLTSTDMTIAEIAQRCGYSDSSFFTKQFRKYKGLTPRQYRGGA